MQLRQYQREAVNAIYAYFSERGGHPLIVMPTASGKSLVLAAFIKETLDHWPDQRILLLTHVKELIQQNYLELVEHWPLAPAGVYSAGLKRREANAQILFAGIQSIHNRPEEIGACDLVMIDECHLVSRKSDSMYRRFLEAMAGLNEQVKVIGLTATHYRLDSGILTDGDDRLFTDIAYNSPVRRLVEEGWLCRLMTKAPVTELDVSGVHTRGGEFIASELEEAVDRESINRAAVREILHFGRDRKSWLVFCAGVGHAKHIRDILRESGIRAETVSGETNPLERDYILGEFKSGKIKAVTNCNILTTGFNHPEIDILAILRPTQSTGLYVQMVGRGMRNAPGKSNCLILDFARNIDRHGPIDCIDPDQISHKNGNGEAPTKVCPECRSYVPIATQVCPDCGHQFPPPERKRIEPTASAQPILTLGKPFWVNVQRIHYSRHKKDGRPDSLRVDYYENFFTRYSEWVCMEHGGTVTNRARYWWANHGGSRHDITISEALEHARELMQPSKILVQEDGKYWKVLRHDFERGEDVQVSVDEDWPEEESIAITDEEAPF